MTSKTLKTTQNISLTLDKEFIQFCELNEIEDIEKLAKETFKRGFDLLKYGKIPEGELTRQDQGKLQSEKPEKVIPPAPPPKPPPPRLIKEGGKVEPPPEVIEARPMKSSNASEVFKEMGVQTPKKDEKKDLYDE